MPTELVPFRRRRVSQHEVKAPAVTLKTGRPAREEQSGSTGRGLNLSNYPNFYEAGITDGGFA